MKKVVRKFNGFFLSAEEYECNIAVCKAEGSEDTWYLATNMDSKKALREYKKRFIMEFQIPESIKILIKAFKNAGSKWKNEFIDTFKQI
ncbi:hypothetical protein [Clostridium sp. BJN0013]|uniref:hypothetical protein n=1 Tax=Clostridium sp. BJN0013 TaxID=3236840 RepID=UPI0034C680E3